ncbi:MAG: FAD binding domain-containing protein [Anaerolineales bacterium]
MWQSYYLAGSLDEAVDALGRSAGQARIVAGATDLILELERGVRRGITRLIDITTIPDLDSIRIDDGWVRMGPLVTHNHCVASPVISERAFCLARACWEVGAPQIRNRGTIAGNLITASPANDSIPPLMALGARVRLRSTAGEREVALRDFYTGVRKTVMTEGEVLTEIAFPLPPSTSRSTFVKHALRRAQAISVIDMALYLQFDGASVAEAALTLGSVAPTILHATKAEEYLRGRELTAEVIDEASRLAQSAARPIDDLRGSGEYRHEMIRIDAARALRALATGQERADFPTTPVMLWGAEGARRTRGPESASFGTGEPIRTVLNGQAREIGTGQEKTLLRFLREDAGLIGTKEGCAEGECGACTVFLDGTAVMACMVPAPRAHGAEIVTVEGLAQDGALHPLQQAFVDEGAVQCGYCTPGFLMSGVKLLEEIASPTRGESEQALTGNLCRCTGYYKILSALDRAAAIAAPGRGG